MGRKPSNVTLNSTQQQGEFDFPSPSSIMLKSPNVKEEQKTCNLATVDDCVEETQPENDASVVPSETPAPTVDDDEVFENNLNSSQKEAESVLCQPVEMEKEDEEEVETSRNDDITPTPETMVEIIETTI